MSPLPARLLLPLLLSLLPAAACANADLATRKNCLACHQVERKVVGPAYRDVAKRYAGQADATAQLAEHIRLGSSGRWGAVPMPATAVTPDEARQLAAWVLSLK